MIEKIKILLRPIYVPILVPILRRIYGRWPRLNPRSVPVLGPLSMNDGDVVARTSVAWMDDPKYLGAVDAMWSNVENLGLTNRPIRKNLGVANRPIINGTYWKLHTACWAASHAIRLDGDFVECGVGFGTVSRAGMEYTDFANHKTKTY